MWLGQSFFFKSTIFCNFYTQGRRGVATWDLPMLLAESNCACMLSFRSVTPFLFLTKVTFFFFFLFLIEKGLWQNRLQRLPVSQQTG